MHDAASVEHGEGADPIGDEVGHIVGCHHGLAQLQIGEFAHGGKRVGIGLGRGDELEETHVARGIEKVRAEPALAHIGGQRPQAGHWCWW